MAILERPREAVRAEAGRSDRWGQLRSKLRSPADGAALALFRIGFGLLMIWESWRYVERGFIRFHYLEPEFLFTYWGFHWVRPHDFWTYLVMVILALAGAGLALGLFYRVSAALVGTSLAYIFLLEKAYYLNHMYLAALLSFVFMLIPAHRTWSLDAWRKPWIRSQSIPTWSLWFMRFQVGVPYVFAGIAKLNFDWLVRAEPLREWLLSKTDFPIIGRFFPMEVTIQTMAIAATLLDFLAPFLLLYRRTRGPVYGAAIGFHFMNSRLFGIGVFPWMMIVATTIFFDPDWPRRMAAVLRKGRPLARVAIATGALVGAVVGATLPQGGFAGVRTLVGAFGVAVFAFQMLPERLRETAEESESEAPAARPAWRGFPVARPLAVFIGVWIVVQLLLPWRHFVIPGNVHWTQGGQKFAWHMLLRQKRAILTFRVTDPATGETWTENVSNHLTPWQEGNMSTHPDMIIQFAHHLEDYYQDRGRRDIVVRVRSQAWLNSRAPQTYLDPEVDFTEVELPGFLRWDVVEPLEPYQEF